MQLEAEDMGLFKCLDKRYWRKFLYIIVFFMLICIVLVTSSCSSSKYSDDKNVEKFCENVVDNSYQEAIDVYVDYISGNTSLEAEAASFMETHLTSTLQDYASDTITDQECEVVLKTAQNINDKLGFITVALQEANDSYENLLHSKQNYAQGIDYLSSNEFEAAYNALMAVIPEDGNYTAAQDKKEEITPKVVDDIIAEMETMVSQNNYEEALCLYQDKISIFPGNEHLIEIGSKTESEYIERVLSRSKELIAQKDFTAAFQMLTAAAPYVTDASRIEEEKQIVTEYIPISLIEMDPYYDNEQGGWTTKTEVEDQFGNIYDNSIYFLYGYEKPESQITIYALDKKYKHFTATLATPKNRSSGYDTDWGDISLGIYCDDVLVYKSEKITTTMRPQQIDLDLTGVSELKFEYNGGAVTWPVRTILGDPVLYIRYDE